MNGSFEHAFLRIISGRATGIGPAAARGALALAEPFYAGTTRLRNRLFDAGIKRARRLARPVISIGNITTGGTGKTPMVRWLAERLRADGQHVAILSRGYRASAGTLGDELSMLKEQLNRPNVEPVLLRANADRHAAGELILHEHPEIDLFLLDDGFQHRRLARDLDIVLINACEPFGFGHVLPRGLLREPLSGLKRTGAIVLTHADQVSPARVEEITRAIRRHNPIVPIFRALHASDGLLGPNVEFAGSDFASLECVPFFAFCGIGNPDAFDRTLRRFAGTYKGHQWFGDHHAYTAEDLSALATAARSAGAELLLTTEKDWVKIAPLAHGSSLPIYRAQVRIEFLEGDEPRLLDLVRPAARSRDARKTGE